MPAKHFTQAAADPQPQPGTAAWRLALIAGLAKRLPEAFQLGLGNDYASVCDFEQYTGPPGCSLHIQADQDLALRGELDCIADQVGQDLLETHRVKHHPVFHRPLAHHVQGQPLAACLLLEQLNHPGDLIAQAHRHQCQLQLAGFDACDVEYIADQLLQPDSGIRRYFDGQMVQFALPCLASGKLQHAQRRADFMAHGREKLRLGLVGRLGLALCTMQLHLHPPQVTNPQQGQQQQAACQGDARQHAPAITAP
ncbi:hypothetical protein D3C79_773870 [compost metagenome]